MIAMNWFMGNGNAPPSWLTRTLVMEKMGWDYWTLRQQPIRIVQDVIRTMTAEGLASKAQGR